MGRASISQVVQDVPTSGESQKPTETDDETRQQPSRETGERAVRDDGADGKAREVAAADGGPEFGASAGGRVVDRDLEDGSLWYKRAVVYEVFVRSFMDSNGDGVGDLRGLTSRLRYIQEIGVTAVWLLPIFQSPLNDHGYDVSDYRKIHPDYGTLEDFDDFVREAHALGLRVIIELVPNHTSSSHPWFAASRDPSHPMHQRYRDYYIWSDGAGGFADARVIFLDTETSNWAFEPKRNQYYFHRFFSHQPDLNYDNPQVQREMASILEFWAMRGVDGFRVDAPPYLFKREGTNCESLPETHAFFRHLRSFLDAKMAALGRPRIMLLCEANQPPRDVVDYFGNGSDEFSMAFDFPLMPRIFMSLAVADSGPIASVIATTPRLPVTADAAASGSSGAAASSSAARQEEERDGRPGRRSRRRGSQCQWGCFLRNHDELTLEMVSSEERQFMWSKYAPELGQRLNLGIRRRLAPLLTGDKQLIELAHSILFTIGGSPFMFAGDEIGMGDNVDLNDRSGLRTPFQWDSTRNAGFSRALESALFLPVIDSGPFSFKRVNAAAQAADPGSLLNWIKSALRVRAAHSDVFGCGSLRILTVQDGIPAHGLAFVRSTRGEGCGGKEDSDEGETVLVVHNLSGTQDLDVRIESSSFFGQIAVVARDLFTSHPAEVDGTKIIIKLSPHEFRWIGVNPVTPSDR